MKEALEINIHGIVQGVGFRPFVYRLAELHQIKGWVENRNSGVKIYAEGEKSKLELFYSALQNQAPAASKIESIHSDKLSLQNFTAFQIKKSKNTSDEITGISPDIAVCTDCMDDIKNQENRIAYPFTNCTNCGPRFTIIMDLPYDRANTSMNIFEMCEFCSTEYKDVYNRRFHAQPVACNHCGPVYQLITKEKTYHNFTEILERTYLDIENGKIIAVKGLGGFHLMCNAFDQNAVERLRKIKLRDGKPFAVMYKDINTLEDYTEINDTEKTTLLSWQRPIVLLKKKTLVNQSGKNIATGICNEMNTIGAFLPYLPFHHLLFSSSNIPAVVLTSGNISDEPIVISNQEALIKFSELVDGILTYNRDIYNRTDDSVVFVTNHKSRMIRRSRGYVPGHVQLNFNVDGILATGAELSNCFAVGKDTKAFLSQHIGDLKNLETFEFYQETFYKYLKLFRIKPVCIVSDLHPDYFSSQFAETYQKENGILQIKVQHHHAHIASCMAEHGMDEKVIGVAFDGTGLGTDGNIWGSEFLICDYLTFERYTHFDYIPLPGGDKSNEQPWRIAVSMLYQYFGIDFLNMPVPFLENLNSKDVNKIIQMIDRKLNCPLSSGAGRLFDAIAALMDVCVYSTFHAEAPMRLESIINQDCHEFYSYQLDQTISFKPMLKEIITDLKSNTDVGIISARFHNTIINCIFETVLQIANETGLTKAVLSGGVFQNKYLLENLEQKFENYGMIQLFTHQHIPSGDGGIALGQLAIAAKRKRH